MMLPASSESNQFPIPQNSHPLWFAIRIRTRLATAVAAALQQKGYEVFLPLYQARKQWSDRLKVRFLPLFPGYLFCRFSPASRLLPILTTPGVIQIVSVDRKPCPVGDNEIQAIQSIIGSGLAALPWPFLQKGVRVRIDKGPLCGLSGIVLNASKGFRLVVSVPLLQRSVAVEMERDWIFPINQAA